MILVEARHHLALVGLVALLHQRAEASLLDEGVLGHVERRKPQERRVTEIAGTEETAGLQMAQAVRIARLEQERAIEIVRLLGHLLARHGVEAVICAMKARKSRAASARMPLR